MTVEKDTVTINKALLSDQGVYTCTAHSDVGSVSGVSKVTIKSMYLCSKMELFIVDFCSNLVMVANRFISLACIY